MDSVGSDFEDDVRPTIAVSKRFKFTKKFFDECSTVDHASVPRKLRSASKKRSRKSTSPTFSDSKKMNHKVNGVELLKKDAMKKSKLDMQNDLEGSPSLGIAVTITKDEEEVVETLYALAGMFPDTKKSHKMDKTKLDEPPRAGPLALPETENFTRQFEVPEKKKNTETIYSDIARAPNCTLNIDGSSTEALKVKLFSEESLPDLSNSKRSLNELNSCVPPANLPILPRFSKAGVSLKGLLCNYVAFNGFSEPSPRSRSMEPKNEGSPSQGRKLAFASEQVAVVEVDDEALHTLPECKNNGQTWPGMSSMGPSDAEMNGTFLQSSSAARLPAWLSNATHATRRCPLENVEMTRKVSQVSFERKSWKRCSSHVYVSHLIEVLQITEGKDRLHTEPTQWVPNNGSKQGGLTARYNRDGGKNDLAFSRGVSTSNACCTTAKKNSKEVASAILLHKRLLQDQQQTSATSGLCASQKQGYDFLSLSSGACEAEANNSMNREENGLEPLTQYRVPYLQPLAQNHAAMPFLLPQNQYSTPLPDHLSAAAVQQVQIQLPPYLGNTVFGPSHLCITTTPKQQQEHQQKQRNWAAYLAAHCKNAGIAPTNIPNWQNGGCDSLIQCAHTLLPSSHSSLEALGPKYTQISMQQQQFVAINSSLSPARIKRQHHHLPSGYEENGGKFHPDGAPLKLLYNGHL